MKREKLYRDKDWLYRQYIERKQSSVDIAEECGVNDVKVRYWLRKYDIRVRTISESRHIYIKKYGAPMEGKRHFKETKAKIGRGNTGKIRSEELTSKISATMTGKKRSEETKAKMSAAHIGKVFTKETKVKMSGKNHPNWKGGTSFEPYCILFDGEKKEEIRNRDNRVCQLCGKSEILNGERLSVHHIDGNKMQGCKGEKWQLISLCRACHSKKDTIEKEFLLVSNLRWRIGNETKKK